MPLSTFTGKYFYKPLDEVKSDLIGLKITDVEDRTVIHLEDAEGRGYTIDLTGDIPVVHAHATLKERLELLEDFFSALLEKLNISEEELLELLERGDK